MKMRGSAFAALALTANVSASLASAQSITLKVPGASQIQLAGRTSSSEFYGGSNRDPFGVAAVDRVPQDSPVLADLRLTSGQAIRFTATGQVDLNPQARTGQRLAGPSGTNFGFRLDGPNRSFSSFSAISARHGSLIGIFENGTVQGVPYDVNFLSASEMLALVEPRVNQPFLIGDGKTPDGRERTFIVPSGSQRLYLGVLDQPVSDNQGEFSVDVSIVPKPSLASQIQNPIRVLGTSNIMLADLAEAKAWNGRDSVPWNSPPSINVQQFQTQSVKISATGAVDLSSTLTNVGPNGTGSNVLTRPNGPLGRDFLGNGRGFSGIDAPRGALIGAFVSEQFNSDLNLSFQSDFSTSARRNANPQTPRLQELFFIGNGRTDTGVQKDFVIPAGATRLFLGIHEGDGDAGIASDNYGAFTVTLSPNAPATPRLPLTGAVNSIANGSAPFSPGTLVVISGSNFAETTTIADRLPIPTSLAGTKVLFDLISAPVFRVSPSQITAQVPFELAGESTQLVVQRDGVPSVPITLQLTPYAPGIISLDGRSGVVWRAETGELVGSSRPARSGDALSLYAIGVGATRDPVGSGDPPPSEGVIAASAPVSVIVEGAETEATFAGLAPGLVGIYQINFVVPPGLGSGLRPLRIKVAGVPSNIVLLPIQN
ncbi:MAG: IPT/TIG domain-containing protein [Bryobacteraceae bacterium]